MSEFVHQRHKPPSALPPECDLVVACPPLRSNVNLSRIVRVASCCGVRRMVVCGRPRIDEQIARQGIAQVTIESHRTLPPVLRRLKEQGYQLVGLEQATDAQCLYHFRFQPRTVLVPGNERHGLDGEILGLLDRVVEIPVFGLPYSHNVATATAMALYEYCRQLAGHSS
jgi:tRNA G18 (ribose-2'-O)-methylase SpoU